MSLDGRELRNALGRYATGVCVISTVTDTGQPVGMTANSFSSVSLDPPLVLWSLQNDSEVYDIFSRPRFFAINILAREHEAHSNQYARKGQHEMDAAHYRLGKHGSPLIHDALVSFECELEATHEGGDHLIIVGRIRDLHESPDGEPLLFFSGGYHKLHSAPNA